MLTLSTLVGTAALRLRSDWRLGFSILVFVIFIIVLILVVTGVILPTPDPRQYAA